tara:strand:- start:96 stop:842 length:747 start_codon:yes stop_codon:yes gene_type:complete
MIKKHNQNIILKKPSAVLFDTDNTLYEYYPAKMAAEEAACKKAKNLMGINRNTFFKYYEKARGEIKQNLSGTASSHSRLLYFQRMIELLGLKAQLLLALDLEQTFWRTFLANAPLFPGVRETLTLLKEKEIPIGVVTDLTSHIQLRKLTYFGLEDTFDAVVTSEEIGRDKPDKRNFLLLIKKLNINKKNYFWMIGDDPNSDIYGAKQLGATTFQKIHAKVNLGKDKFTPDYSFNSYLDLSKFIMPFLD